MSDVAAVSVLRKFGGIEEIEATLLELLRRFGVKPDLTTTKTLHESGTTVLLVTVAPGDFSKVLGNEGRTARSLRVLTRTLGTRIGLHVELELAVESQVSRL